MELAVIPILNFKHSANTSHLRVAITRPTKLQKHSRIFLSSFLHLTQKPKRPYVTLFFVRAMIYIHTFHFPLNLEIISPEYECEDTKGSAGWEMLCSHGRCLQPCHSEYSSIIGCVPLYCNYLLESVDLSVASISLE